MAVNKYMKYFLLKVTQVQLFYKLVYPVFILMPLCVSRKIKVQ